MAPKTKTKKQTTSTTTTSQPTPDQQPPNWPALSPLLPTEDLILHPLLPAQILTITNLFTPTLAKKYVSFLRTLPLVTTPSAPKRGHAVRVNDRYQVTDPSFAKNLYTQTGLESLISRAEDATSLFGGEVLGLNPNIRVYRYSPGQFFDKHYDDANDVVVPDGHGKEVKGRTTWTLLLYLTGENTGVVGGETVFYPEPARKGRQEEPVVVGLEEGMALLHRHGGECMVHEGREVTGGEKWVLRSDLVVRR